MNTIAAQEIKRRGISAVDEKLAQGPVHVIRNNEPRYVVLTEERYRELVDREDEACLSRVKESLEDYKAGRVNKFTSVDDLLDAIDREGD